MQPRDIYHRTVQGTHSAPLHSGLRADYNGIVPSTFARHLGHQYLPAHPPRGSRHQVEACCTARIARAAWRTDGTSALISTNCSAPVVPEQACGADAALGQSPEHGPEFSARRFISRCSEQDDSTARRWLARCKIRPLPGVAAGSRRGQGPMGVHDSGDDASLWVVSPPCTAGPIKDRSRGCPSSSSSSLSGLGSISACTCCSTCLSPLAPPTYLLHLPLATGQPTHLASPKVLPHTIRPRPFSQTVRAAPAP